MSNSFGRHLRLTTFGESHGEAIGFILDGVPAGLRIDFDKINFQLSRRKPGQSKITTQRKEKDEIRFLSGIKEAISLGTPIAGIIENKDRKSSDYDHIEKSYRPGHADMVYDKKYGIRDHRGGGRSSARETANWVAAGAIAMQILEQSGIQIYSFVRKTGKISLNKKWEDLELNAIDSNIVRCPDEETAQKMIFHIDEIRKSGDTIGGEIRCIIKNVPVGLGEPVFDKLQSRLAQAMLSINAVKGFQYGSGFSAVEMKGSEHNDSFYKDGDTIRTRTNNSGGIQGGISTGQDIYFDIAFKPVSTIMTDQQSLDEDGNEVTVKGKGRHDPCVVPRAVPIVDALSALVLADFYLLSRISKM